VGLLSSLLFGRGYLGVGLCEILSAGVKYAPPFAWDPSLAIWLLAPPSFTCFAFGSFLRTISFLPAKSPVPDGRMLETYVSNLLMSVSSFLLLTDKLPWFSFPFFSAICLVRRPRFQFRPANFSLSYCEVAFKSLRAGALRPWRGLVFLSFGGILPAFYFADYWLWTD